jgi:hypothetical protein
MPGMKRLLVVVLLAAASASAFASGVREDESFSYSGIERVEVKAESLAVEVRGEGGFSVSMRSDLPADSFIEPRRFTVKHEVDGSLLRVWVERDAGLFAPRARGALFFTVPRNVILSLECTSGDARVSGISARELHAKTRSGDLRLSDIEASTEAETVSGDLEARRVRGEAVLTSVSGKISFRDLDGKVSARTMSGEIAGDRLRLSDDASFKTVSGDVVVGLVNELDELRYELSTVSGRLQVGTVRAARGLQMGSGSITLRGETVSGDQVYR